MSAENKKPRRVAEEVRANSESLAYFKTAVRLIPHATSPFVRSARP